MCLKLNEQAEAFRADYAKVVVKAWSDEAFKAKLERAARGAR